MNKSCVLASASPRRKEILEHHDWSIDIIPAHIEENLPQGIAPKDAVMFLALKKALWIEAMHPEIKGKLIIASDTIVYKNEILGKPKDFNDGKRMLSKINGTNHQVITGVAMIVSGTEKRTCFYEVTEVYCKAITEQKIIEYLNTDEPYDKAGAYAIQGNFGKYIDHIEGDYENVVGLPYYRIQDMLNELMHE